MVQWQWFDSFGRWLAIVLHQQRAAGTGDDSCDNAKRGNLIMRRRRVEICVHGLAVVQKRAHSSNLYRFQPLRKPRRNYIYFTVLNTNLTVGFLLLKLNLIWVNFEFSKTGKHHHFSRLHDWHSPPRVFFTFHKLRMQKMRNCKNCELRSRWNSLILLRIHQKLPLFDDKIIRYNALNIKIL